MSAASSRLVVLLPLYNDWAPAEVLLTELDAALRPTGFDPEVLIIDDGSTQPIPETLRSKRYEFLRRVGVLHLRANVGHQRAIAVGLVHVWKNRDAAAVAVMDADGQDRAEDLVKLLERFRARGGDRVVFAERTRRLEKMWFQTLYYTYRWLHRLLTGDPVKVGNFSVVPHARLGQLAVTPEIWNHYAAAVIRSRMVFETVPIVRWRREHGRSHMSLVSLLLHGLSAFFVYGEILGARLLLGVGGVVAGGVLLGLLAFGSYLIRRREIPVWLPWLAGFAGLVLLQMLLLALVLIFIVVGSRAHARFLPARDCGYFEDRLEALFDGARADAPSAAANPDRSPDFSPNV